MGQAFLYYVLEGTWYPEVEDRAEELGDMDRVVRLRELMDMKFLVANTSQM